MVKRVPTKDPELLDIVVETASFYWVAGVRYEDQVEAERKRTQLLIEAKYALSDGGNSPYEFIEWLIRNSLWVTEQLVALRNRLEAL